MKNSKINKNFMSSLDKSLIMFAIIVVFLLFQNITSAFGGFGFPTDSINTSMSNFVHTIKTQVAPPLIAEVKSVNLTYAARLGDVSVSESGEKSLSNEGKGTISEHGICETVTNNSGEMIFIPTKTPKEWESFIGNLPSGVTMLACDPVEQIASYIPTTEELVGTLIAEGFVKQECCSLDAFTGAVSAVFSDPVGTVTGAVNTVIDGVTYVADLGLRVVTTVVDIALPDDIANWVKKKIINPASSIVHTSADGIKHLSDGVDEFLKTGETDTLVLGLYELGLKLPAKIIGTAAGIVGVTDLLDLGAEEIVYNGSSLDKVDILFLSAVGKGYALAAASYNGEYDGIFSFTPFKEQKTDFNIWYKGYSADSSQAGVQEILSELVGSVALPSADVTIVLSDQNFRSHSLWLSGNAQVSIPFADYDMNAVALTTAHEMGHGFAGLADEYTESGKPKSPRKPNCAPSRADGALWWAGKIAAKEVYDGCAYTSDNARPYWNTLMRDNWSRPPNGYGAINEDTIRYYINKVTQ